MHPTATLSVALPSTPPEWVQLLPLGTFSGRDGRGPWRVRGSAAAGQIVAASLAYAATTKPVIDYDHQTDIAVPKGGTAPAAGWIAAMEVRSDGIWGRVEWTDRAQRAIASREFRYLSPVFDFDQKTGDIRRILRAGLTNSPALNLTALASTGAAMQDFLNQLARILALPDGADQAAILAAIGGLLDGKKPDGTATASVMPDPSQYVPRGLYDSVATELASIRSAGNEERAMRKVDAAIHGGRVTPAQRDWAMALCCQDPQSFDRFIATAPQIIPTGPSRLSGRPPSSTRGNAGLSEDQLAVCSSLGLDPKDYAKNLEG